jgi:ActR/RegA family two-component response regulator
MSITSDRKVLWVEDIPLSVRANTARFEEAGYRVDIAMTVNDAIKLINSTNYQYVFVDFSIPQDSNIVAETSSGLGVDFIKRLIKKKYGESTDGFRIFLCTAHRESVNTSDVTLLGAERIDIVPKAGSFKVVQGLTSELDMQDDE